MNCQWVEEQLSAYVDQEVDAEARRIIEEHVEQCEHCRTVVTECRAMGSLVRRSERPVDCDAVWARVSDKLEASELNAAPMGRRVNRWIKHRGFSTLAVAASIGVLFFALRHHNENGAPHTHVSFAVDFKEVLHYAKNEPELAVATLVSRYEGRELNEQETSRYLGYEPALFTSIPEGFTRASTYVLNMPCCKCSASICQRRDGSALIVFEHRDEQPVWFGDLPSIETLCAGKTCKIIESAGQLAVSWKNQDRQLTLIGANDLAEVNQWVTSLKL